MMNKFHRWPSPAKLNLFLYITGQRADGYHQLQTLFQFLDFGDQLNIKVTHSPEIMITPALTDVPLENNLIYKAAMALRELAITTNSKTTNSNSALTSTSTSAISSSEKLNTQQGAEIQLDKILPMGGGLGGGSSNAATTLIALNEMWQYHFSIDQLADIGLTLGADVPVFVRGTAAFAEGVGEQLTLADPDENWYLVLKPNVDIATQKIFSHPDLTRNTPKRPLDVLLNPSFKNQYHNDCQQIVTFLYPEVADQLSWLLQYAPSRLTGTGACVFAELDNQAQAKSLLERFKSDSDTNKHPSIKTTLAENDARDNTFTDVKNSTCTANSSDATDSSYATSTYTKTSTHTKNSVFGFIAKGVNISPLHKTLTDYKQQVSNP